MLRGTWMRQGVMGETLLHSDKITPTVEWGASKPVTPKETTQQTAAQVWEKPPFHFHSEEGMEKISKGGKK